MNRRSYISTLGASIVFAGCSSTGEEPVFTVTKPTVTRGETGIIAIEVTSTWSIHFSELPGEPNSDRDDLNFQFENADFTPSPDTVWQGYPPAWTWSPAQNIEGEVPVQTFSDTPPGTYQFSISFSSSDVEEEKTRETSITVESSSD